jgi:anti-sigma regulatory factor (Ser/Thr protein kinase)
VDDRTGASGPSAGDDDAEAGIDAVVGRLLGEIRDRPGVRRVGLALVEGAGRRLRFTSDDRQGDGRPEWCHIDAYDDVPLTHVVRTGEPLLSVVGDLDPRYDEFARRQEEAGVVAVAVLPIPGDAGPVGGLIVYYEDLPAFDVQLVDALTASSRGAAERLAPRRDVATEDRGEEPAADGVLVATTTVDGDPRAARAARQFLRRELSAWQVDDRLADVAVLCMSELVTNAVMHAGTVSELRVSLDDATLKLVVRDRGGPAAAPAAPDADDDPLRVHGRGLQLVDALAQRWGAERDDRGTTVWVELDRRAAS